jgi:hypothetical protein
MGRILFIWRLLLWWTYEKDELAWKNLHEHRSPRLLLVVQRAQGRSDVVAENDCRGAYVSPG